MYLESLMAVLSCAILTDASFPFTQTTQERTNINNNQAKQEFDNISNERKQQSDNARLTV